MLRIWTKLLILLSLLAALAGCSEDPAAITAAVDAATATETTNDLTGADVSASDEQAGDGFADTAHEPVDIADIFDVFPADEGQIEDVEPADTGPQCPADCAQKKAAQCQYYACESGVCTLLLAKDATPCDDGNGCTVGDACAKGACVPGPALTCASDNNPCTGDACDPTT